MQLLWKKLAKEKTVRLKETLDVSGLLKGRTDVKGFGELEADLQAELTSGVAEVTGQLTLDVQMVCARCLGPVHERLAVPFREVFTEREDLLPEKEREDAHIVTEDAVDLKPFVEEAVWLALPNIPLCKEDCKGLCPVCGTNRNETDCACKQERIDPRLAGLADFFKDSD
ncbi:DUF177 domain-containing protein [Paenibacillus sp. J31TS4]|uniref:YceD family protein n=1 Tax=Paenibacillus sp. J31TS4 TaxID=2807195 RepID=UPI001BD0D58F|nr:DUF177 domain-containing protein [Paenibacillus sp. J31TS4]